MFSANTNEIHDALASSDVVQAVARRLEAIERTLATNVAAMADLNKKHDTLVRLITTLTETCAHEAAGRAKPRSAAVKKPSSDGKQPFVDDIADETDTQAASAGVPTKPAAKASRSKPTVVDVAVTAFVAAMKSSTVTEASVTAWRGDTKPARGVAGIKKMLTDYAATLDTTLRETASTYIATL